ncbi:DUF4190 domain-containing protein [Cellulomonas fengjieae]|uniref:DUF4190 domain-containing protein n=1 Tax=Cellulomonas fengjieae TaxID=2819978 RepID=UPI001AAF6FA4|nr:DUF4190 domain-containing protein [Cellulomonas fengjieae]MBO3100883.1 DUF4190 domain-containing protein [Cellulomonas fengjieae]
MSNETGGPAVPDPYAPPESTSTDPSPAPSGYEAVPPSGYEAVRTPVGETAPTAPYGGPTSAASPYAVPAPTPDGEPGGAPAAPGAPQPGAPQYGAPQYTGPTYGAPQGAPQYGAPQYGAPPQGASQGAPPYGSPQYGAPQYGAPGYPQPPYGAQPYGYGQPYATPPTEGMAIASFVTSAAGLFFLGGLPGPVGIWLGIAALRRIKTSGKAGRGWAIAGIAVGGVGVLAVLAILAYIVFFVLLIAGTSGSQDDFWDDPASGIEEGTESTAAPDAGSALPDYTLRTDLAVGTCLTTYPLQYDMADTDPVDCAAPHDAEVVGTVTMSGPVSLDLELTDPAYDAAWTECDQLTEGVLPFYFSDGTMDVYYPHPDDFAAGRVTAYCVFYGDEPGMTGSAVTQTLQLAGTQS